MADKISLNIDIVGKAYDNFVDMFYPGQHYMGLHFWAFIGVPELGDVDYKPIDKNWMFIPEYADRIKALAGPHHQTIAKAMVARGHKYQEPLK